MGKYPRMIIGIMQAKYFYNIVLIMYNITVKMMWKFFNNESMY